MRRSPPFISNPIGSLLMFGLITLSLSACSTTHDAEAQPEQPQTISVDVAIAELKSVGQGIEYIGTTAPIREVSIQAQTQGQLLKLHAEVGDRIQKGQILAQLDDSVLTETVNQARAQREAQISEVASGERRILEAKTRVEQAKVDLAQAKTDLLQLRTALNAQLETSRLALEQAQRDAERLIGLQGSGVTTQQEAEQAQTAALQAQQTLLNQQAAGQQQLMQAQTTIQSREQLLKAAQQQVAAEQKTAEADARRIQAQQSLLDQAAKEQSFSTLTSPINGVIMARQTTAGTFLQTGQEVLIIGDFSQIKILAQVSEQQLGNLTLGQPVQVHLDAFQGKIFQGKLARISPIADANSRLVPIEIVMNNPGDRVGAGLLARVSLAQANAPIITVPETALQKELRLPNALEKPKGFAAQRREAADFQAGDQAYLFIADPGSNPEVRAREVTLGDRYDGQIEIRQGLQAKERYVARSSRPLEDGMSVNVSAITQSETR